MKTLKVISTAFLLALCMVSFGQSAAPGAKLNTYLVTTSHTPEQCVNTLSEFKDKGGDALLSKFEFGCMSGDHTAYAFLDGKTESEVRQMLPKDIQLTAKIQKVDKFTPEQIERIHKDHMNSGDKK
jgi:hypothetical protein